MIKILFIIAGAILVSSSSIGLIALLRIKGWVSTVLAFFTTAYATIVLLAEVLSELHVVRRGPLLIGHLVIAAALSPWTFRSLRTCSRNGLFQTPREGWRDGREALADPVLAVLGLFVVAAMVLGAYLIAAVPPNTFDSMTLHLSRVAHWLQDGTLRHLDASNPIKTMLPPNAEIGLLWVTALWGNDRLAGFVQWLAAIATTVSIYGVARRLRFPRPAGLFAALLWNTFTVVVVQATSTKNDLLAAAFCSIAFYFLLDGLQDTSRGWNAGLTLFGLSIGLAGGVKPSALLILPAMGVILIPPVLRRRRQALPALARAACWCLVGFVLLGAYNYVLNREEFGAFGGAKEVTAAHSIQHPTLTTFGANIGRIGYHFADPGGLPEGAIDGIQRIRPAIGRKLFALLRIEPNPPETNLGPSSFDFDSRIQLTPREDAAWYGPLGFLLFWPVILYYLFLSPFRQRDFWKWSTALAVPLYAVLFAISLRWNPWIGRMFLIPVAIGSPLLAGFYRWSARCKALRWAVLAIALTVLGWSATHNAHKPVLGAKTIGDMDYYELRTIQAPETGPIYRALDASVPQTARLGVMGPWPTMRWDYFYFGPNLERKLVFLGAEVKPIRAALFTEAGIDDLLVTTPTADPPESEVPLQPLGYGWGLYWFVAQR